MEIWVRHMTQKDLRLYSWLPSLVAIVGILITIPAGYWLMKEDSSAAFINRLTHSLPWIFLVTGILVSFLLALLIRYRQVTKEHKASLDHLSAQFKKEIQERLETEETKQKLEKALLQGQKLQAIGTLAGGIAHDFNNILYAIMGYVEMAREDVSENSLVFNNLGKVLEAAHRGQDLIARILAFSRRHHHEFKGLCLQETLAGVLSLLKPTIPASINIEVHDHFKDKCIVLGNETQLHQVIVNIINNAVDAMEEEGTVTIDIDRLLSTDEAYKEYPKAKDNDYCKIAITDSGHGMDQPTIERIFEPFFTTKEVGKGTGLGLSTVHAIIEEHNGAVLVDSQLGRGTTFTILLPELIDKEN